MSAPLHQSRDPKDRVHAALDHIERAQGELLRAAEALSSIVGLANEHRKTLEQYDRMRAHWYKVREASQRKEGKLKLDEMALRSCEQREGVEAINAYADRHAADRANRATLALVNGEDCGRQLCTFSHEFSSAGIASGRVVTCALPLGHAGEHKTQSVIDGERAAAEPNGTECERHGMRLCPVCVGFLR